MHTKKELSQVQVHAHCRYKILKDFNASEHHEKSTPCTWAFIDPDLGMHKSGFMFAPLP